MPTEKIANPYEAALTVRVRDVAPGQHTSEGLDAEWAQEVNQAQVQEIQKKNGAPAGTYVTDPSEYAPILTTGREDEKNKAGDVIGSRLMASVLARGMAKIKTLDLGRGPTREVTQVIRFKLSPDARQKKIYDSENKWTGEYDAEKNDLASRLWADAVLAYQEYHGKGDTSGQDVLKYLETVPVALRCMQGDRGDLIVLAIQNRGRRRA